VCSTFFRFRCHPPPPCWLSGSPFGLHDRVDLFDACARLGRRPIPCSLTLCLPRRDLFMAAEDQRASAIAAALRACLPAEDLLKLIAAGLQEAIELMLDNPVASADVCTLLVGYTPGTTNSFPRYHVQLPRCGITCHGRTGSVRGHTNRPDRGENREAGQDEEKAWREKERQRGGAR